MSALSDLVKHAQAGDMIYKGAGYEHPYSRAAEASAELATLEALAEAKAVADELLKEAKDIFDGELSLCDDANTSEWLWKWKVRYYFEDTEIPPHPLPDDMKVEPS